MRLACGVRHRNPSTVTAQAQNQTQHRHQTQPERGRRGSWGACWAQRVFLLAGCTRVTAGCAGSGGGGCWGCWKRWEWWVVGLVRLLGVMGGGVMVGGGCGGGGCGGGAFYPIRHHATRSHVVEVVNVPKLALANVAAPGLDQLAHNLRRRVRRQCTAAGSAIKRCSHGNHWPGTVPIRGGGVGEGGLGLKTRIGQTTSRDCRHTNQRNAIKKVPPPPGGATSKYPRESHPRRMGTIYRSPHGACEAVQGSKMREKA